MRTVFIAAAILLIAGALFAQEVVFKNYNLKHLKLSDPAVRNMVESEIRKALSPNGEIILDERTNSIIVRDNEDIQNKVTRILAKLDVGKPEDDTSTTITVRVSNVKASDAREALEEEIAKDNELKGLKISHSDDTCAVVLSGTSGQLDKAKAIIDAMEEKFRSAVETKVYKVRNRSAASLARIVELHLPGAPGTGVAVDEVTNSLIVRETKQNLAKVAGVVEKFDTELATLLLQFRIIYASHDGEKVDDSIKDVADELKKLFDYTRYEAHEGPLVKVQQGHSASVEDTGSGMNVEVRRCDYDAESGKIRIEGLKASRKVEKEGEKPSFLNISTTIKVDVGHTVVLGGASSKNAKDALIVVVKASVQK